MSHSAGFNEVPFW